MKLLTADDLLPVEEYKKVQQQFLQKVIQEKKVRRVKLNDIMSGLFENRLTVWYQIQEMIRAENITKQEYIDEMLEVYNDLLPAGNEMSMTLFIEIPNQEELRTFNRTIVGIENCVFLQFGSEKIRAYEKDAGGDEDYTQSIHYLKFPFSPEQAARFREHAGEVAVRIEHSNFQSAAVLAKPLVDALKAEVTATSAIPTSSTI